MTTHTQVKKKISQIVLAVGTALVLLGNVQANAVTSETESATSNACSSTNISTSCTISGSSIAWVSIDSGSGTLTITESGSLSTSGKQIVNIKSSGSNWTIDNKGKIENKGTSDSGTGILIAGSNSKVNNAGAISAVKSGAAAILITSTTETTITNSGTGSIKATDRAIKVQAGTLKLTNTGSGASAKSDERAVISGGGYAIEINSGSGHTITNTSGAAITGGTGIGVAKLVTVTSITNGANSEISGRNNGIFVAKSGSDSGTVTTLNNEGSIGSINFAVKVNGKIETLTNSGSGSIWSSGNSSNAIYLSGVMETLTNHSGASITSSGSSSNALFVTGTLTTLTNSGSIVSTGTNADTIYISGAGAITNLTISSGGSVEAQRNGFNILARSGSGNSIDTLTVSGTGKIVGNGGAGISNSGKIGTLSVTGVTGSDQRFTFLEEEAEAEDGEKVPNIYGGVAGILTNGTFSTIDVKSGGTIAGDIGISNTVSGTRKGQIDHLTITDSGSMISGGTTGISNANVISSIEVKNSASIQGGVNGILNTGTIDSITIGSGASISGGSYGIANSGTIRSITIESGGQLGAISNTGTLAKPIVDEPNVDESESADDEGAHTLWGRLSLSQEDQTTCSGTAICVLDGGQIGDISNAVTGSGANKSAGLIDGDIILKSTQGIAVTNGAGATINGAIIGASGAITSITNAGTIVGDITIVASPGQKVSLSNTQVDGIVGKISFNGSVLERTGQKSQLEITDWNTKIVASKDESGVSKPVVPQVHIAGSGGEVVVQNVTITSLEGRVANGAVDLNNVFTYGDSQQTSLKVENAVMSESLISAGWAGYFDKEAGMFQTDFSTERSAGGILGQALSAQLVRRDFFLDSVMTQTAADALYNRLNSGTAGLVFAKPYASFDNLTAGGENFSGDTLGVVGGFTGFWRHHIVTGFVGYESSSLDADFANARMSLGTSSVYGGVSVARVITSNEQFDTFGRVTAKVSYTQTDFNRDINSELSTGHTSTLGYGADAQFGVNYKLTPVSRIVPMVGVGFSAGKTADYAMENSITLKDSYKPDAAQWPYAIASVTWHQVWLDYMRSYLSAGIRYNFKTEMTSAASFDGAVVKGSYEIVDMYQYLAFTVNMKFAKHTEFSYGYTGVFDQQGQSHNLLAQYKFLF